MANDSQRPALLLGRLTPCYDLFATLLPREESVKRELIAHARIAPGARVLNLGAGTGTLAIKSERAQPGARVVGLDADPEIVAVAHAKA